MGGGVARSEMGVVDGVGGRGVVGLRRLHDGDGDSSSRTV
jgi:hypothetical protein